MSQYERKKVFRIEIKVLAIIVHINQFVNLVAWTNFNI